MITNESKISQYLNQELVSIEQDKTGTFNDVFHITSNLGKFVVKIFQNKLKSADFCDITIKKSARAWAEYYCTKKFEKIIGPNIVPKILFFNPQKAFIIFQDVGPAKMLRTELLAGRLNNKIFFQIAKLLAQAHQATFNIKKSLVLKNQPVWQAVYKYHFLELVPKVDKKTAQAIKKLINFYKKEKPVLLHGDMNSRNILIKDTGFYLIDFELARLGHPAYDLGHFLAEYFLLAQGKTGLKSKIYQSIQRFLSVYFQNFNRLPQNEVKKWAAQDTACKMLYRIIGRAKTPFINREKTKKIIQRKLITIIQNQASFEKLYSL